MGVVSGMRDSMANGVQFGGDATKFFITFTIEIVKRHGVCRERRTEVGLYGERGRLEHIRQSRAAVLAAQSYQLAALCLRE
ncbi:Uncharacterised protein [Enterobacter cancerogenus]|uniref:Uncharacterized protein n=1 Tax=Enterobacter cancerogenus TaxID=69218 RepID=A0A484Z7A9_9ENTR|nr:Uncharacterised protein [Enterobacter cancerogenus]